MKKLILIPFTAFAVVACDTDPAEDTAVITNVDTAAEGAATNAGQAGAAAAQPATWDADNDTLIDRNEWTGFGDQGFLGWDADDDDAIGPDEFERGWTEVGFTNAGEAFTALDDDNDRRLVRDEFFAEDEFAEWDVDNNDVLERNEFRYYAVG